jgi:uncharacterized protein
MNPFTWILSRLRKRPAPHQTSPEALLQVSNLTRRSVLANRMEVADSAPKRSKGLLGREQFSVGEGLWIIPCEAVHTFAMSFPIDLVYLDREKRIKKLRSAVSPWRISACLTAHSVIELPSGTIRKTQTQAGDTLEFSPASQVDDVACSPACEIVS